MSIDVDPIMRQSRFDIDEGGKVEISDVEVTRSGEPVVGKLAALRYVDTLSGPDELLGELGRRDEEGWTMLRSAYDVGDPKTYEAILDNVNVHAAKSQELIAAGRERFGWY